MTGIVGAQVETLWTATSAWPHHPALLPPLPREARSSALEDSELTRPAAPASRRGALTREPERPRRETVRTPRDTRDARVARPARSASGVYRTPISGSAYAPGAAYAPAREAPRHATRHVMSPANSADARPVRPATRQQTHARAANARSGVSTFPANLDWPSTFDDWMIDIMRRRALRLNSGARRRGALGSVRAVELAHIMERSRDGNGHWICAICTQPVTLDDLSFDHIVALADGGEHAAHNLAPAHRKCNEIKGSEKAQYRAQSLDRWLTEWATGGRAPGAGLPMASA
jgi:HNH endonuclease